MSDSGKSNGPVSCGVAGVLPADPVAEVAAILAEDARLDAIEAERKRKEGRPRRERRREARERLLPTDRMCPKCGRVFLRSRQWVERNGVMQCVGCDRRGETR